MNNIKLTPEQTKKLLLQLVQKEKRRISREEVGYWLYENYDHKKVTIAFRKYKKMEILEAYVKGLIEND